MADYPYIKIVLMSDLMDHDEDGFTHIPIAIESTPGLDVEKILRFTVESFDIEATNGIELGERP